MVFPSPIHRSYGGRQKGSKEFTGHFDAINPLFISCHFNGELASRPARDFALQAECREFDFSIYHRSREILISLRKIGLGSGLSSVLNSLHLNRGGTEATARPTGSGPTLDSFLALPKKEKGDIHLYFPSKIIWSFTICTDI